jgi:hypothetical protein
LERSLSCKEASKALPQSLNLRPIDNSATTVVEVEAESEVGEEPETPNGKYPSTVKGVFEVDPELDAPPQEESVATIKRATSISSLFITFSLSTLRTDTGVNLHPAIIQKQTICCVYLLVD